MVGLDRELQRRSGECDLSSASRGRTCLAPLGHGWGERGGGGELYVRLSAD